MANEPKDPKASPNAASPGAALPVRQNDSAELKQYLRQQRTQLEAQRDAWCRAHFSSRKDSPPLAKVVGQFTKYLERELIDRRGFFVRSRGFTDIERRDAIAWIINRHLHSVAAFGKARSISLARLLPDLVATELAVPTIQAVADAMIAREYVGPLNADVFSHLATELGEQSPAPKGRLDAQVIDLISESKKQSSVKSDPSAIVSVLEKNDDDKDLDLLPAQFRRIREIQPEAFARLKAEVDALVAPDSLKKKPSRLPKNPPRYWRDRDGAETPPEFFRAIWGDYLAAGLISFAELKARDPALASAISDYCRQTGESISSILPTSFKRGVVDDVAQLLREGKVDEAYRLASPATVRRARARLKQEKDPSP